MKAQRTALEVLVLWGDTPLAVDVYHGDDEITVGSDGPSTYLVPPEVLRGTHTLARRDGEAWVIEPPPSAQLRLEGAPEYDLVLRGPAPGGVRLRPGAGARVTAGDHTLVLRAHEPLGRFAAPIVRPDWTTARWLVASAAAHAAFVSLFFFAPPHAGALSLNRSAEELRYVRAEFLAPESVNLDAILPAVGAAGDDMAGQPMPGESGAAGAPDEARQTGGRVAVKGSDPTPRVPLTREAAASIATLDVLRGAVAALPSISSPFGDPVSAGFAADDAYGTLLALNLGFSPGPGGFGIVGTSRGGGCRGADCLAGTVGVGDFPGVGTGTCDETEFRARVARLGRLRAIESCSIGAGGGTDGGLARGTPGGPGGRESAVPTLRPEQPTTVGGLSREDVRRVVHRNLPQVRHCYEQGLLANPALEGRVAVRFVIAPSGAVMASALEQSTLAGGGVSECVVGAVRRWPFPASEGTTAVTYPFTFQPAR